MSKKQVSQQEEQAASRIEWILAGIGGFLLLGTIVFLCVQAFRGSDGLPVIELRTERIEQSGDNYTVSIIARNSGETAASQVQVRGELIPRAPADTATTLTAECSLDYVPSRSQARAALVFPENPAEYELRLTVSGYQQP